MKKTFFIFMLSVAFTLFALPDAVAKELTRDGFVFGFTDGGAAFIKALQDKALTEITVPSHVSCDGRNVKIVRIEDSVFRNNPVVRKIVIPGSIGIIGNYNFNNCPALMSVSIGEGEVYVFSNCFVDCPELTEVVFPGNLQMGDFCFSNIGIESIVLPVGVGRYCFGRCPKLRHIDFSRCRGIGLGSFSSLPLITQIDIIQENCAIEPHTFNGMENLHTVRFPAYTENLLGIDCFNACPALSSIYVASPKPPFYFRDADIFSKYIDIATCTLYVPEGCAEAYKNTLTWGFFSNIREYSQTGIGLNTVDSADDIPERYFDLSGREVSSPGKGIYICRKGPRVFKIQK